MAEITGGERLKAKLEEIARGVRQGGTLKVGFLQGATYPDGKSVAMIAAIQEFGAPAVNIPPRPFFRNMVAKESGEWPTTLARQLKRGYDTKIALGRLGALVAGQLRQSIVDFDSVPLKDATIARKGFSKQLVESGNLLNSIDFQVDDTRFEGPRGAVPWGADK